MIRCDDPRVLTWLCALAALLAAGLAAVPTLAAGQTSTPCPRSSSADRSTRRPRSGSARRSTTRPTTTRRWRSSASTRPGGLEESMRGIVQDIIDAPMPVVVYVSPNGARAASAGAFITEAGRRRGDGAADQHRLGERGDLDRGRHRRHPRARRSRTTPPPSSGRSPRPTGATATVPERMVTDAGERDRDRGADANAIDLIAADQDELLTAARRLPGQGPEGDHARHRRAADRRARHPVQYQLLAAPRQPDDRLPAAARRPGRDRDRDLQPGPDHPRPARRGLASCSAPTAPRSCR